MDVTVWCLSSSWTVQAFFFGHIDMACRVSHGRATALGREKRRRN
jgi:hypothetical protein